MKIFRNLLKYTIGLPIMIIFTLLAISMGFLIFVLGTENWNDFLKIIIEVWKPII